MGTAVLHPGPIAEKEIYTFAIKLIWFNKTILSCFVYFYRQVFDDLVRFVRASYVETDDERIARINKVGIYMAVVI